MPYGEVPHDHVLVRVALPADVGTVAAMREDPRAIGDGWIAGGRSAVLSVPSVVPGEGRNLLQNPAHPRAREARILWSRRFASIGGSGEDSREPVGQQPDPPQAV